MNIPEIPATATEEYLEKLTEKIFLQIEAATNQHVRERLHLLLEKVETRKRQLLQEAQALTADTPYVVTLGDTAKFSTADNRDDVKQRFKDVLAEINKQRRELPLPDTLAFPFAEAKQPAGIELENVAEQTLTALNLNDHEYELVRQRMAGLLDIVKKQAAEVPGAPEPISPADLLPEEEGPVFDLEDEILEPTAAITPETPPTAVDVADDALAEIDEDALIELTKFSEITAEPALETLPDDVLSGDVTFETACRRIGNGEALAIFGKIPLSSRERAMLNAFQEHLHQMRGVKRQQAFDMQHLTARSIRELEQIFKTYHLQGYLRAELGTIYNRLLNLRSRFSLLLH